MLLKADIPTYLNAILAAVRNDLAPALTGDYAKHRADLIQMLLLRLVADAQSEQEAGYEAQLQAQLDTAQHDTADMPEPLASVLRRQQAELASGRATAQQVVGRLIEALSATKPQSLAERTGLDAAIRSIALAEQKARQSIEARIESNRERAATQTTTSEELAIPEQVLTDYLRRRFPERPGIRAANVSPVPGGRSKGTVLFECVTGDRTESLVIRKDFSRDFMGCTVADEYPIVRAAWLAGLPVPEPKWLEADRTILDGKFIVFERIVGRAAGTMFESKAPPSVVRDLAAALGRLHSLDIRAAGLADSLEFGNAEFAVGEMVAKSYEKHRSRQSLDLLYECAHSWLMNHLDCIEHSASLVHGDLALHNVLAHEGHLTAILDWELAHAGDPAEDLMSCRTLAEKIIPWDEFMDIYIEHGGRPVAAERQQFFTIWKLLKYSLFASSARDMFESGVEPDVRLAAVGYNTYSRLQENLARALGRPPT